ncbi:cyclin-dependent kinase 2-interacting protein-like [Liolophura sinensis]|uniref:cyclin-dependent kinase 2-interacting protein-like n=1 Tax=Liolophura sinensis TaxID=3198878 RepID=UPI0031581804
MSGRKKRNRLFHEKSPQKMYDEAEENFSPVKSPSSPYHMQRNLQGSARKIKDAAADWHNGILKWNSLNSEGVKIINKIANIKLERMFACQQNESEVASGDLMSPDLEPLCEALTVIVQSQEKIVRKMKSMRVMLVGVKNLEAFRCEGQGEGNTASHPLFQSWSITEFEETFKGLGEMYEKELELKKIIGQNVAHAKDRNALMMYTSSWLHQPYIEERAEILLEGMLIETGHK